MVNLRESVGNDVADCIIDNAKILLKHYLFMKYQFKNIEFWGEDAFCQWDLKIAELRSLIVKYR